MSPAALAPRRFPQTVTRRRQAEGRRNAAGEWVPGGVTETELRASVQPLKLEDVDLEAGAQLSERLKIYVPGGDYELLAAFENAEADRVVWRGAEYTVIESRSWVGSHTRATVLREV